MERQFPILTVDIHLAELFNVYDLVQLTLSFLNYCPETEINPVFFYVSVLACSILHTKIACL
jgi:hypothetical protein